MIFAVQKIRSILSNGIQQIADVAVEQQHTDGDGRHAVCHLAIRSNANRPSSLTERFLWPTELDVHDVTAVGVDRADRFNLLPRDVLRHQSLIKNAAVVNRKHDRISGGAAAETAHEKSDASQARYAKPSHERAGDYEARDSGRCGAEKDKAGHTDLAEAPREGSSTKNFLRLFNKLTWDCSSIGSVYHGDFLISLVPSLSPVT